MLLLTFKKEKNNVYDMYYEFSEKISKLPAHRILASKVIKYQ